MTADIRFLAIPTGDARALQRGGKDAYGNQPQRRVSGGSDIPCRHCLQCVAAGEDYLVLAYRPFATLQPYAETGPIFLHGRECDRAAEDGELPSMFSSTPDYILRGYDEDDRIVYGTGGVVPAPDIAARAHALLTDDAVAYVHMRSARNNCYQLRIESGAATARKPHG